jgi:hypothetical protein
MIVIEVVNVITRLLRYCDLFPDVFLRTKYLYILNRYVVYNNLTCQESPYFLALWTHTL